MKIVNDHKYQSGFVASSFINSLTTAMLCFTGTFCSSVLESFKTDLRKQYDIEFPSVIFEKKLEEFKRVTKSDYLQNVYLDKHCDRLIRPQVFDLIVPGKEEFLRYSYVPLTPAIQKFVKENPEVLKKLNDELKEDRSTKEKEVYSSMMDGSFADRLKGRLKLEFFLDDVELSPACGFGKSQKFVNVYFAFADLAYEDRVRAKDISVVMMANRKKFKDLNIPYPALFKKMIDELKHLMKKGVNVEVNGEMVNVKVTVCTLTGDNLGRNLILIILI